MNKIPENRPSPITGRWYESDPQVLAQKVDSYISQAELPELPGEVVALIAPHAGHVYSGPTAGYAFRSVKGKHYDVVVVVSPVHHGSLSADLQTTAHQAYQTPLGAIQVSKQFLFDLAQALEPEHLFLAAVANDQEHSLEIELPFLQRALTGENHLLPVMIASQEPDVAYALGRALAQVLAGCNVLLVASTDLSHFCSEGDAAILDAEMLRQIQKFSPEGVFQADKSGRGSACGVAAVAAVLTAARLLGGRQVKVLHHSTSGDVTGDYTRVVGYGAAVVLR
jgi:AmmeMemoRadiSam system protein B